MIVKENTNHGLKIAIFNYIWGLSRLASIDIRKRGKLYIQLKRVGMVKKYNFL